MRVRASILICILISCKPTSRENLETTADNAFESGKFVASIDLYTLLIEKDSVEGRYYYGRGFSLAGLGRFQEAAKDFLKSADLNYEKAESYFRLGGCYAFVNDSVAVIYFKKAYEISSDSDYQQAYQKCLQRLRGLSR